MIGHIILLTVLLLCSCSAEIEQRKSINSAEILMHDQPDSALNILKSISNKTIRSKSERARHALLYSQALDKNWIDTTNDSLISVAVKYYSKHNDTRRVFLSYYYHGRILHNAKNHTKALLAYTKAENLAFHITDKHALGLLYAQLGLLYSEFYDHQKSLSAYQYAYKYYTESKSEAHQYYTLLNISQILLATGEYKQAEEILHKLLNWADKNNNNYIYQNAINLLIFTYENLGDISSINNICIKSLSSNNKQSISDCITYAYQNAYTHDLVKANEYINRAWKQSLSLQDTLNIHFHTYHIYKQLHNYKAALESHEKVMILQDSIVRYNLQQPLISAQRDFYQANAELAASKLQNHRYITFIILTLLLFAFCISAVYIRYKIDIKNMHITRYMDMASELASELNGKDIQINNLFKRQFALLDKLSKTYYETHSTSYDKEAIYKEVKREISLFSNNKYILSELETIVNGHKDNILTILRKEVPMSDSDYRLLCLYLAGFSAKAISVFTNDSTSNIYTRKSRLKQEIIRINPTNCEKIISHL